MSVLHSQRPYVVFDPSNQEHRQHYADFIKSGSWSKCPVRFYVPEYTGMDQVTMIRSMLVNYYIEQEFQVKDTAANEYYAKNISIA